MSEVLCYVPQPEEMLNATDLFQFQVWYYKDRNVGVQAAVYR